MNKKDLLKMGLTPEIINKKFDTLEELKQNPPGIVIGECIKEFHYSIDYTDDLILHPGQKRVMSLHLYSNLEYDQNKQKLIIPYKKPFIDYYNKYEGENLTNKTLLIWRTGGIGDLLFIQPNLFYLKKKYPTCKIWFHCSPKYHSFIDNWDCLDKIGSMPMPLEIFEQADYHITFEGVIERTKDAEKINVYKLFSKWMNLNLEDKLLRPIVKTKEKNDKYVEKILSDLNIKEKEFILIQIRASSIIRSPGTKEWFRIMFPLLKQDHRLIIIHDPRYSVLIDKFIDLAIPKKYKHLVHNFAKHSKTIDIASSIVNKAKLVIAPDSSLTHIAEGLGVPALGIYAAFNPKVRLETYKYVDSIEPLEKNYDICEYGGKHCFLHGQMPCPSCSKGFLPPCYSALDFQLIQNKIKKLLER